MRLRATLFANILYCGIEIVMDHKESLGVTKYWHDFTIMGLLDFHTAGNKYNLLFITPDFGFQLMLNPCKMI
jgi:hypothetical protein